MQNYIKSTLSMSPVMPVLTINDIDNVEYLFEALLNGNLKVVEITLRTNCALKAIEIASKKFPSLKTGAGTILSNEDLNSVKDLLGHSSLAATQVYTNRSIEEVKKIFKKSHPRSKSKN